MESDERLINKYPFFKVGEKKELNAQGEGALKTILLARISTKLRGDERGNFEEIQRAWSRD
jgi:hypothetical protein